MSGSRISEDFSSRMPGEQDISSISDWNNSQQRAKTSKVQADVENAEFMRAPTPRILPKEESHRGSDQPNCVKLGNCMSFCTAQRFTQEDMLEEDMGIDTRYLMRTPAL